MEEIEGVEGTGELSMKKALCWDGRKRMRGINYGAACASPSKWEYGKHFAILLTFGRRVSVS